jgi:hypothetical protein
MKTPLKLVLGLLILASAAGCNKPQSMAQTQQDVDKAAAEANKDVAESRRDADKNLEKANEKVDSMAMDADHARSEGNEDVAITAAKGAHKVAIEKCESLAGDAQSACKKKADAELDVSKAQAKQQRVATDPKT